MIKHGIAPCLGTGAVFALEVFFFILGAAIQDERQVTPGLAHDRPFDSFLK
jgi:hypothetical protein